MSDMTLLGSTVADRLAGLLFELAAQLHVERTRRLALETALARSGVLQVGSGEALADDPELLAAARAELDRSMERLMRILAEQGDAKAPLRAEALTGFGGH
ncbi:MAG: hypothetical protein INF91_08600 [Alphaproteobacteria bacterium]|nr:hypothetical protein [Alphaproteobacteria bacterium]